MDRDNRTWLNHLRSDGPLQQAALSDLRDALLRGLRRALSNSRRIDESLLEDAVQDALLRILDRLDQFQGRSRFLTWATSIAIHIAMNELRRRRWRDVSLDEVMAESNVTPSRAVDRQLSPDAHWERTDVLDTLHDLIQHALTEKQRTALLAELKGMPLDEIARHLGSNPGAVYKLTHDARRKLKRGLEAAGYDAHDISATTAK